MVRSTEDVFEDHLRLRLTGDTETDVQRNYSPDVVLLTSNSSLCGHEAIRISARRLREQLPDAAFEIMQKQTRQRYALLIWRASSSIQGAIDGADSFVIENGMIVFQSIHYRLIER